MTRSLPCRCLLLLAHPRYLNGFILGLCLVLCGCEEEAIRSYEAPKAPGYTEQLPKAFAPAAPVPEVTLEWDVPEGWAEAPSSSSILFAEFAATTDAGDARVTVTRLTADGGGVLSNINRWRGQVGLDPVPTIEAQPMDVVTIGDGPAAFLDLTALEGAEVAIERMLVVILPRLQEGQTWYFKATGPPAALDQQKNRFIQFVQSVRFVEVAAAVGHDEPVEGQGKGDPPTESAESGSDDPGSPEPTDQPKEAGDE